MGSCCLGRESLDSAAISASTNQASPLRPVWLKPSRNEPPISLAPKRMPTPYVQATPLHASADDSAFNAVRVCCWILVTVGELDQRKRDTRVIRSNRTRSAFTLATSSRLIDPVSFRRQRCSRCSALSTISEISIPVAVFGNSSEQTCRMRKMPGRTKLCNSRHNREHPHGDLHARNNPIAPRPLTAAVTAASLPRFSPTSCQ